jgi:putative two-component system hydrogenase maturation factor HypX/HoxX
VRILLLCHAFNALAQRLFVELSALGHELAIEFDVNDALTQRAVERFRPEIVLAPFLKRRIPESVWSRVPCLIVHPGIPGDRGPSSLDWAILEGEREWGVTVLQATGEMDAGPVWAHAPFPMRLAPKSSLYRREVTEAAVVAVGEALARFARGAPPVPAAALGAVARGRERAPMKQAARAIDWMRDTTEMVLRRIHAADGFPGVRDEVLGLPVHLHGAHAEAALGGGPPGAVIAQRDGAILRATIDGAVWITHLKRVAEGPEPELKLPAAVVLGERLAGIPDRPLAIDAPAAGPTWREIRYEERGPVGVLHFAFHNGAMSAGQSRRLLAALTHARSRPTRVLVLAGGPDFWSNGIHLNAIEDSALPADASWESINAIDDVAREILTDTERITVSALAGNAGAGGVFLALAADRVWMRPGVVLNPHYKGMGNLYGSEYWTYTLPRRVGEAQARRITERRLPMGCAEAVRLGLADERFGTAPEDFLEEALARAQALASAADFEAAISAKRAARDRDEAAKPLERYRSEELERMKLNFYGFDPSYHVARYHFARKLPKARTPAYLARLSAAPAGCGSAPALRDSPAPRHS